LVAPTADVARAASLWRLPLLADALPAWAWPLRPAPSAPRRPPRAPAPPPRGGHEAQVALGDLLDRFGRAGHGVALLALALPAFLPLPLTGTPVGIGIVIAACRIALGLPRPWMPGFLRRVRLRRSLVLGGHAPPDRGAAPAGPSAATPLAVRGRGDRAMAARIVRPGGGLGDPRAHPFGNQLPALAVAAFGLGLVRRDGFAVLVGHGLTVLALGWAVALLFAGTG
jgi:hypothetical protein